MVAVAIIGAGELGGALAHILARRGAVGEICLIDESGRLAAGKALDIAQAGPVEPFSTQLSGLDRHLDRGGAAIVVVADRAERRRVERRRRVDADQAAGADGVGRHPAVRRRIAARARGPRRARAGRSSRARLFGSAPDALAAAARAIVALETRGSPRDVALSVLGVPPAHIVVIPWDDATIGGFAATRVLDEPVRRRIDARLPALWPPGRYALAAAASKVIDAIAGRSRQRAICFVAPDAAGGRRMRTAALPVRLGSGGIVEVVLPALSAVDRVALDNAMLL